MTHLYLLTGGSYEDYTWRGIYRCDHKVTEEEYKAHFQDFKARQRPLLEPVLNTDIDSPENAAAIDVLLAFESENDPVATFVKKHNMTRVEVEELWDGEL